MYNYLCLYENRFFIHSALLCGGREHSEAKSMIIKVVELWAVMTDTSQSTMSPLKINHWVAALLPRNSPNAQQSPNISKYIPTAVILGSRAAEIK